MSTIGKNTGSGFLPNAPAAEDILSSLGLKTGGWDGLSNSQAGKNLQDAVESDADDLKRCYVQVYSSPAGRRVIEDLMDQTLRRSPAFSSQNPGGVTMDQQINYVVERMGQNGLMTYILSNISAGMNLAAPKATRKKSNK